MTILASLDLQHDRKCAEAGTARPRATPRPAAPVKAERLGPACGHEHPRNQRRWVAPVRRDTLPARAQPIDLSHVGQRTMLGAIEASSQPVLLTHANARTLANLARNKSDDIIKAVAQTGGVIGASIYGPMCWDQNPANKPTIEDYIRHLEHIVNIAGVEQVAFGTDLATGADYRQLAFERTHWRRWDGINRFNRVFGEDIPARYLADCNKHSDLPKITEALARRGWREEHIRGYLGKNLRRVLDHIWTAPRA